MLTFVFGHGGLVDWSFGEGAMAVVVFWLFEDEVHGLCVNLVL